MDEQKQTPSQEPHDNRFESDTEKLFRQHMADPNHVITDEELANVRVGMSPGPDEPTRQAIEEAEGRKADEKTVKEDKTVPGAQKITPWDTVDGL